MPRKLVLDELNRLSPDEFKQAEKFPYCLVLDNVRSMANVGSIFRTADAFRATAVYLCGITGQPPHREITKTALGATESVTWYYVADVLDVVKTLRAEGWKIAAVEQAEGATLLGDFRPAPGERWAFVLGNEVDGVQENVVNVADLVLEIPQFGTKHSLNVAVSAGILCWDVVKNITKT